MLLNHLLCLLLMPLLHCLTLGIVRILSLQLRVLLLLLALQFLPVFRLLLIELLLLLLIILLFFRRSVAAFRAIQRLQLIRMGRRT